MPINLHDRAIARVNRLLGRELDHNDVVPGRYTLEVSSPGLERNLRTPHHFQREVGKDVSIRLVAEHEGQRRFAGALVAATDATATVRVTDTAQSVEIPLALIEKAKTVFVWESQPKPNSYSSNFTSQVDPCDCWVFAVAIWFRSICR